MLQNPIKDRDDAMFVVMTDPVDVANVKAACVKLEATDWCIGETVCRARLRTRDRKAGRLVEIPLLSVGARESCCLLAGSSTCPSFESSSVPCYSLLCGGRRDNMRTYRGACGITPHGKRRSVTYRARPAAALAPHWTLLTRAAPRVSGAVAARGRLPPASGCFA